MIAWEWTIEKAREGEEEKTEKKKTRKISQSAQVEAGLGQGWGHDRVESGWGWAGDGVMMGWRAARRRGGARRGGAR